VGVLLLLGVQHLWVIVPLLATYGFLQAAPLTLFPLADAFELDQVEGLVDDATIGQLAGILYEFNSQGRGAGSFESSWRSSNEAIKGTASSSFSPASASDASKAFSPLPVRETQIP
jgi:hypothetical protein